MTNRDLCLLKERYSGEQLEDAVKRVESGEPLAYVLGQWYFYGLTFGLNKDCLIPRPDTEHVVERAIASIKKNGRFADLCTGSGCIAISVLANRKDLRAECVDISENAVSAAKENARLNGVEDRCEIYCADVFDLVLDRESFDCIISNPPYIDSGVVKELEVSRYEPIKALDGGEDGMDFYRYIVSEMKGALKKDGSFIFEIGYDQKEKIENIAAKHGMSCHVIKDYGGNDRVAVLSVAI